MAAKLHLCLALVAFAGYFHCFDTSMFYSPFSIQTRLLFHHTRIFLAIGLLVLQVHSSSTSAPTLSVHIDPLYTHKATKFIGSDTSSFISHSARNTKKLHELPGCLRYNLIYIKVKCDSLIIAFLCIQSVMGSKPLHFPHQLTIGHNLESLIATLT
jgi:hypothetical protein